MFTRRPADIDEATIKDAFVDTEADAERVAATLAEAKAVAVSTGFPGPLVIGASYKASAVVTTAWSVPFAWRATAPPCGVTTKRRV